MGCWGDCGSEILSGMKIRYGLLVNLLDVGRTSSSDILLFSSLRWVDGLEV